MATTTATGARTLDIVLAGVGGQGSVLATEIFGRAAVLAEVPVVTSEVHGMSQRGGTVVTAVRLGSAEAAPLVPAGSAKYLLAFEPLEAVRQLGLLRDDSVVIMAEDPVNPVIESLRQCLYPEDTESIARSSAQSVVVVPALAIAEQLGNVRLASTVMLGVLSVYLDLPEDAWRSAITQTVPRNTVQHNLEAFQRGASWRVAREKAVTAF
jgi:indolepyruvate ferredoxin oxidoreductase beta subunit